MAKFDFLLRLRPDAATDELRALPGAVEVDGELHIPTDLQGADLKQRFLELADLESVAKAAVVLNLPSKLRLGSKLLESRWVYFTVTVAEVANYLRVDPWDCMQEFFVKGLSDGKFAYAFPARDDPDQWSVDTAYWSLYLAHAAKQEHLISPGNGAV